MRAISACDLGSFRSNILPPCRLLGGTGLRRISPCAPERANRWASQAAPAICPSLGRGRASRHAHPVYATVERTRYAALMLRRSRWPCDGSVRNPTYCPWRRLAEDGGPAPADARGTIGNRGTCSI